MIKIDNLNRSREVLLGEAPSPRGAIADHHFLLGPVPTSTIRFGVDASPKGFGRFDASRVGCRAFLARRSALGIRRRLREDTSQFHFPGARLLALFPSSSLGFRAHHRHPRPIHLDIEHRNLRPPDLGQLQLQALLDFFFHAGDGGAVLRTALGVGRRRDARLPQRAGGYSLDLDSTVLERYGEQQGVKRGYNPRKPGRGSHHPLLAVLGEAYFILHGWLRSGNTAAAGGVVSRSAG